MAQDRLPLGLVEESDLLVLGHAGQLDAIARVDGGPAALRRLGVVEERRQGPDVVVDRLRREPLAVEHGDQVDDVLVTNRVERLVGEERHEVHAKSRLDGGNC